jgi:butyryl-CoA dehydrogenase
MLVDRSHDPDETVRGDSAQLLDLLTPIVKSWSSDACVRANEIAVQVLGGYGFTREYPVEQCYRDNRINPIHEGSNGIQAIDLLGRKAMQNNGAALKLLFERIEAACVDAESESETAELAKQLRAAAQQVAAASMSAAKAMAAGEIRSTLANAQHYMNALGHVCIGWMWLWQALAATRAVPQAADHDVDFYRGKLQTCRWFFAVELPTAAHYAALVSSNDSTAFAMSEAEF